MAGKRRKERYFLLYRDAAGVIAGMQPGKAHNLTFVLQRFGVIEIVSKGKSGANSQQAAEFHYLLESGDAEEEERLDL